MLMTDPVVNADASWSLPKAFPTPTKAGISED